MALGCSTNTVLHLLAISKEAKIPLDLKVFDEISRKTPILAKLIPSGPHSVAELHQAGGIPAVMKELSKLGLIYEDCLTVSGKTIGEIISKAVNRNPEVLRPAENPYSHEGVLRFFTVTLPQREQL